MITPRQSFQARKANFMFIGLLHNQMLTLQICIFIVVLYFFSAIQFQGSIELYSNPFSAQTTIDKIPSYCIISYHHQNFSLSKPNKTYIKFFMKGINEKMNGFLPYQPHNANFLGPYIPTLEDDLNIQFWNSSGAWVHLKNMYTTYTSALVTEKREFITLHPYDFLQDHPDGNLIGHYQHAITLGHSQVFQIGHFYQDVIAPLLLFPNEIINKSVIIANAIVKTLNGYQEAYDAFNISLDKIVFLKPEDWVFCDNLYTAIDPASHLAHYGTIIQRLSMIMRRYYRVEKIIPTKFYFCNRTPGKTRYIKNLHDVVAHANLMFPKYHFEYLHDEIDMRKAAIYWSQAKFILAPAGSNCIREIFMKEGSIMIAALGNFIDNCMSLSAATHGVFTLYFRIIGMVHSSKRPSKLKIPLAMKVTKIGLYVIEHGHFDPNEDFNNL